MRELIELGYNVIVVNDTVGARVKKPTELPWPNYGYTASFINWKLSLNFSIKKQIKGV